MEEMIGVIDVGGGWRGIYAAGVLDYCMDCLLYTSQKPRPPVKS